MQIRYPCYQTSVSKRVGIFPAAGDNVTTIQMLFDNHHTEYPNNQNLG